jgi:3-methyladenine DNA glycosylase/8-oxoguanine DNA glycosylase
MTAGVRFRRSSAGGTARAMTAADYPRARRLLTRRDPVLGGIIAACGRCGLAGSQRDHDLRAMVESIVSQQLSGKAAATIFSRLVALFPPGRFPPAGAIAAPPLAAGELSARGLPSAISTSGWRWPARPRPARGARR